MSVPNPFEYNIEVVEESAPDYFTNNFKYLRRDPAFADKTDEELRELANILDRNTGLFTFSYPNIGPDLYLPGERNLE